MLVYIATNRANGKQYVGQTSVSLECRIKNHKKAIKYVPGAGCAAFHSAVRKYGFDAFTFESVDLTARPQEELDFAERWFIDELQTISPNGYNLKSGGNGGAHHESTKVKLRAANVGKTLSLEHREKIRQGNKGKYVSEETRRKLSIASTGKKASPETLARLSARMKGTDYARGHVVSESVRQVLREKCSGWRHSPDARAKIGAASRAYWARRKAESEAAA